MNLLFGVLKSKHFYSLWSEVAICSAMIIVSRVVFTMSPLLELLRLLLCSGTAASLHSVVIQFSSPTTSNPYFSYQHHELNVLVYFYSFRHYR